MTITASGRRMHAHSPGTWTSTPGRDQHEATKAPLPVIEVKDLEATFASVTATGAPVTKPIFSFPGGRRFHFLEPNGNELAAMQLDPEQEPGEFQ